MQCDTTWSSVGGKKGGKSQLAKSVNNHSVLWNALRDDPDLIALFVRGVITERRGIFCLCCGLFKTPSHTNPITPSSTTGRLWLEMQLGNNICQSHLGPCSRNENWAFKPSWATWADATFNDVHKPTITSKHDQHNGLNPRHDYICEGAARPWTDSNRFYSHGMIVSLIKQISNLYNNQYFFSCFFNPQSQVCQSRLVRRKWV